MFTHMICCSEHDCTACITAEDDRTAMYARVRARLDAFKQGWRTSPDPLCPIHRDEVIKH